MWEIKLVSTQPNMAVIFGHSLHKYPNNDTEKKYIVFVITDMFYGVKNIYLLFVSSSSSLPWCCTYLLSFILWNYINNEHTFCTQIINWQHDMWLMSSIFFTAPGPACVTLWRPLHTRFWDASPRSSVQKQHPVVFSFFHRIFTNYRWFFLYDSTNE